MSRQHQFVSTSRTLVARFAVGCAAAVVAAGCGAGQMTQTDSQVAAVNGAAADVGSIALRDVLLAYPEDQHGSYPVGSSAPLQLTIINQGNTADVLESVSTPMAAQVLLQGASTIPATMSIATRDETAAATQSADTAPGAVAAPSDEPLSPLDFGEIRIVLVDLTQPLRPGLNTQITFTFRNAGPVTIPVPIAPPTDSERQPLNPDSH